MMKQCSLPRALYWWQRTIYHVPRRFSTSARKLSHGPNAPLDLDPSLQELLRDIDMSVMSFKLQKKETVGTDPHSVRELEVLEFDTRVYWEGAYSLTTVLSMIISSFTLCFLLRYAYRMNATPLRKWTREILPRPRIGTC